MSDRPAFAGYLDPKVRDRLINYYASDPVYYAIQETLAIPDLALKLTIVDQLAAYLDSIKWYSDVSQNIYQILQRSNILVETADTLQGKILSDYFSKVSDLVAVHTTLTWYSGAGVLSSLEDLEGRSDAIVATSDFINSQTVQGRQRLSMLQTYLGDDWYSKLDGLIVSKPSIDRIVTWLTTSKEALLDWLTSAKGTELDDILDWWTDTVRTTLNGLMANKPGIDHILGWLTSTKEGLLDWLTSTREVELDGVLGWWTDTIRIDLNDLMSWKGSILDALNGILHKTGGRIVELGKDAAGRSRFFASEGDYMELGSDTHETFSFQPANLGSEPHLRSIHMFRELIGGTAHASLRIKGRLYGERTVLQMIVDPGIFPVAPINGQVCLVYHPDTNWLVLAAYYDGNWYSGGPI